MYVESEIRCYQKKKAPTPKVDASQCSVKYPYEHRPSVGRQRGIFIYGISIGTPEHSNSGMESNLFKYTKIVCSSPNIPESGSLVHNVI